jgi:lysophospholipase L1-like esterase
VKNEGSFIKFDDRFFINARKNVRMRSSRLIAVLATGLLLTTACSATAATKKKKKSSKTVTSIVRPVAKPTPTVPPVVSTSKATTALKPVAVAAKGCAVKVMPLGDSLTAFPESYRGPLFRQLKADGYNIDFVGSSKGDPVGGGDPDGEGHGGYRIGPDDTRDFEGKPANLDANLSAWLNATKPDVILLTIGANDLAAGGEFTAQAPAKLRALVNRIRSEAPYARLVVGDVPPSGASQDGISPQKAINDMARSLADGGRVTYAPNYQRLLDLGFTKEAHTLDGAHFNPAGGELFARAWYPSAKAAVDSFCAK